MKGVLHRFYPVGMEEVLRLTFLNILKSTGNPNLKLGKIKDAGGAFEAEIRSASGIKDKGNILQEEDSHDQLRLH
jgi:hypothetical protein